MREILFRGKRYNGEWIYDSETYIRDGDGIWLSDDDLNVVQVQEDTVGQYTGMKDEYGRKIFEGDIVEFYFYNKTKHNHNGALIKTMLIEWFAGSFYMTELFRNYRLEEGSEIITEKIYTYRSSQTHGVYKSHCCYYAKLVGNKFDNPELLEGEENE